MDPRSSSDGNHPVRSGRGIQEAQVWGAADALLHEGLRPTIERVRQKIGSGSANTVSPMLERWFATLRQATGWTRRQLGRRRDAPAPPGHRSGRKAFLGRRAPRGRPDASQKSEAARRELELQRQALARKDSELTQREVSFEQARVALDEALASPMGRNRQKLERQGRLNAEAATDTQADARPRSSPSGRVRSQRFSRVPMLPLDSSLAGRPAQLVVRSHQLAHHAHELVPLDRGQWFQDALLGLQHVGLYRLQYFLPLFGQAE